MPHFTLNTVIHREPFTFILMNEENKYNIQCDMSWGNGGAGNQNPRILFKLIEELNIQENNEDESGAQAPAQGKKVRRPKDPIKEAAKKAVKGAVHTAVPRAVHGATKGAAK